MVLTSRRIKKLFTRYHYYTWYDYIDVHNGLFDLIEMY